VLDCVLDAPTAQVGEHPTLAQQVNVSLTTLFKTFTISAAQEVTLGANQVGREGGRVHDKLAGGGCCCCCSCCRSPRGTTPVCCGFPANAGCLGACLVG
jgi:hypothetical protein